MPVILATGEQGMGVDNYPGLARGLMATMSKHLANAEKNIGITNEQAMLNFSGVAHPSGHIVNQS